MSYEEYKKLFLRGEYLEAARFAREKIDEDEDSSGFWLTQLSRALCKAGKFNEALEAGKSALERDLHNPFALAAAADALFGLKRFGEALDYYEELIRGGRLTGQGQRGVCESLAALKRWEEILERLSSWNLLEEQTLPWRVKALSGLGRDKEALELCGRWLELKPHYPPALWESSELEIKLHGMEEAVKKASRLARIPSLPQVYREIYASLCKRAGRPEEAVKTYETIGAGGEQGKIQKKKAYALAKSGRETEALPLLEELLKKEPADTYLHSSYSAACRRIEEEERGINFYSRLLTLFPEERSLYGRMKALKNSMEKRK